MPKSSLLISFFLTAFVLAGAGCSPAPQKSATPVTFDKKTYDTAPIAEKDIKPSYPILPGTPTLLNPDEAGAQLSAGGAPRASADYTLGMREDIIKRRNANRVYTFEQYSEIAQRYRDKGYYIQVSDCQTKTYNMVIKTGINFTIDNRDSAAHIFAFNDQIYVVPGYGFAVPIAQPVGKYYLTCDSRSMMTLDIRP